MSLHAIPPRLKTGSVIFPQTDLSSDNFASLNQKSFLVKMAGSCQSKN